jgi:hypothetical protein
MKQTREFKESMANFDRLLRAVVVVPKADVEKEEAKDKLRNRREREKRKRARRKS